MLQVFVHNVLHSQHTETLLYLTTRIALHSELSLRDGSQRSH
jgi:hypothetical protein